MMRKGNPRGERMYTQPPVYYWQERCPGENIGKKCKSDLWTVHPCPWGSCILQWLRKVRKSHEYLPPSAPCLTFPQIICDPLQKCGNFPLSLKPKSCQRKYQNNFIFFFPNKKISHPLDSSLRHRCPHRLTDRIPCLQVSLGVDGSSFIFF